MTTARDAACICTENPLFALPEPISFPKSRCAHLAQVFLLLTKAPGDTEISDPINLDGPARVLLRKAQDHLYANRIEPALDMLKQALPLDAQNVTLHKMYDQAFASLQPPQPDKAIQAYSRSLQINNDDAETHRLVGDLYLNGVMLLCRENSVLASIGSPPLYRRKPDRTVVSSFASQKLICEKLQRHYQGKLFEIL